MKILSLLLLLPVAASTQTVDPVISKDYLDRVGKSQQKMFYTDTTNSAKNALLLLSNNYYGYPIKKISVNKGRLNIQRAYPKTLYLSGNFSSVVGIKTINHLPLMQNEFVQGRSENGNLIWHGAETNEQFSYGPAINTLEYDGSNYLYDVDGRLVPIGSGSGKKAIPYSNSILRTGSFLSQSLVLQARYTAKGVYTTKLKIGQSDEQTVMRRNKNSSANFSISEDVSLQGFSINGSFNHTNDKFSNSNRNGFLNRVYQSSLLTPVSFDNNRGFRSGNDQRRFSDIADNPFFLLEDNQNSFSRLHNIGSVIAERKFNRVKFRIIQSFEKTKEKANEGYEPATAFFSNGIFINRNKTDGSYYSNGSGSVDIRYGGGDFRSTASFSYGLTNARSSIDYRTKSYKYKRTSHDVDINYLTTFDLNNVDGGIKVGNKFYASSTSIHSDFFVPEISGYVLFDNIFNANGLNFKLASNFVNFNSELPISTSFSQYELTKLSTEQAFQFFPVTEIKSFSELLPVRHKELTARAELNYKYRITFSAEVFSRKTVDDVFPLYENGELTLKNLADHRNKGLEMVLGYNSNTRKVTTNNTISLTTYNDVVADVRDGFNYITISGFSNVYKAIVKGMPLGVIVGNRFLLNEQNNIVIASNGFPLVDPVNSVIGDPTPDFILKTNNAISWKRFSFSLDCEWKKGGDIWNGTQAALDYFGRSKRSGQLRNTTGYIFRGVLPDGHLNSIPVSFYDVNLPIEQNRWIRYGYSGVAEEHIQKADYIRINNLALNYKLTARKYFQTVSFTLYASNFFIWSDYKGGDVNQLLYDQSNTYGLDFFNIPSAKSYGLNISIQF